LVHLYYITTEAVYLALHRAVYITFIFHYTA